MNSRQQEATRRCLAVRQAEWLAPEIGMSAAVDQVAARQGVSPATLWRWRAQLTAGGFAALAPRARGRPPVVPDWAAHFLKLWRTPTKRSVENVLRDLPAELPEGVDMPSASQARRFLRKLSAVERERGRMGPNALKSVRAFIRRTTAGLAPGDVYISDGHSFDAEIAHPRHGQPCRPEVTTVLDVATRLAVGWSVALSESTWAVADALRHACETRGIPAIYYADHGPGQENAVLCAILVRLGVREERSIVRNSQARGVIEAFNRNLVAAAKRLPTYIGTAMDRDAKHRVFKLTRRELRLVGSSRLLLPWEDFLEFLRATMDEYNARPHRALGGRSPLQAWKTAIEGGFRPLLPTIAQSADLFRPYEVRTTRRGEVVLHGKRYFARPLEHYHGEQVKVGYDIHDATWVTVNDAADRFLAVAELDGNSQPYFPLARVEQAREGRARAQLRRLEDKAARIAAAAAAPIDGGPPTVARDRQAPQLRIVQARGPRKAAPGEGRQKIWSALRSRDPAWSTPELVLTTGAEKRSINLYIQALEAAGYVEIVSPAGPGDAEPAYYRLARNTGPRAPVRRRDGTVFDRNNEQIAALAG